MSSRVTRQASHHRRGADDLQPRGDAAVVVVEAALPQVLGGAGDLRWRGGGLLLGGHRRRGGRRGGCRDLVPDGERHAVAGREPFRLEHADLGADGDHHVGTHQDRLEPALRGRRHLHGDLVGHDLDEGLVALDRLTDLLQPAGDGPLDDRLTQRRDDDLDVHSCASRH